MLVSMQLYCLVVCTNTLLCSTAGVRTYCNILFLVFRRIFSPVLVPASLLKMVGVAPDERRGRRLPQWVLGTSAADKVKSENIEEKKKHSEEEILPHAYHSDPSTTKVNPGKESMLPEKEKVLESSHVLAKCKTKRRKQRAKQADADSENKISERVPEKKYNRTKRVSSVSASRNKPKTKEFGFKSTDKLEIKPLIEDGDVELTVEDLMTIAEEVIFFFSLNFSKSLCTCYQCCLYFILM